MPAKIKTILLTLALIALVSGWSLFKTFSNQIQDPEFSSSKFNSQINNDNDKDGLTNQEESYWNTDMENKDTDGDGFLDGEEVASGHNPVIAGPADLLTEFGKERIATNLTEKLSALIAAGLYAGNLSASASQDQFSSAVDKLSLAALYDGTVTLTPNELKDSEIALVKDSKKAQQKYLDQVIEIIEKDVLLEIFTEPFEIKRLLTNIESKQNQEDLKIFLLSRAARNEKVIKALTSIDVPQGFVGLHKKTVAFFQSLNFAYQSLSDTDKDPVKALMALNHLQDTYVQARTILSEISNSSKKLDLRISSTGFASMILNLYGLPE